METETDESPMLTAAEFAAAVNLSDRQIRRLMRSGRIQSTIGEDRVARIPSSELYLFKSERGVRPDTPSGMSGRTDPIMSARTRAKNVRADIQSCPPGHAIQEVDTDSALLASQLLPLHERALKLLEQERQERQMAQEAARRAEGQLWGLQHALQSYQRALSENAESIAERESFRQMAENQAKEAVEEREHIEMERLSALETLKLAHERISWLEKRMNRLPRWVRRWLEAG